MTDLDKIATAHEAWKAALKRRDGAYLTQEGERAVMAAWPILMQLAAENAATLYLMEQAHESNSGSGDTGTHGNDGKRTRYDVRASRGDCGGA